MRMLLLNRSKPWVVRLGQACRAWTLYSSTGLVFQVRSFRAILALRRGLHVVLDSCEVIACQYQSTDWTKRLTSAKHLCITPEPPSGLPLSIDLPRSLPSFQFVSANISSCGCPKFFFLFFLLYFHRSTRPNQVCRSNLQMHIVALIIPDCIRTFLSDY